MATDERPRHQCTSTPSTSTHTGDEPAVLRWAELGLGQGGLITVTDGVVYQHGSGTSYPYCDTTTSTPISRITWDGSTFGVTPGRGHPW